MLRVEQGQAPMGFAQELTDLLEQTYHNLLSMEEASLKRTAHLGVTINEMHLIDHVAKAGVVGTTIRELAERLGLTSPSVTVAVNKLCQRGFVEKKGCTIDKRAVKVHLTNQGRRVDCFHRYSHRMMSRAISKGMEDEEKKVLLGALQKLNRYFTDNIGGNR